MPELPEVELARRALRRWMRGATIVRTAAWDRAVVRGALALVGRTVRDVGRRGKWLRVELDRGLVFAHLGMTGDFSARAPETPRLRWERARIDLTRGGKETSVRYVDPRRFGRIVAAREDIAPWRKLGPDLLLEGIDEAHVARVLAKRRGPIKAALLDQRIFAGVGNILANEALFRARIDPRRPSRALSLADLRALARALHAVIGKALRNGSWIRAYGHAGEPCPRCDTRLAHTIVAGRTTTFCPRCQRRSRGE
jgi:formamidopyrimidine-DNA glycosylase